MPQIGEAAFQPRPGHPGWQGQVTFEPSCTVRDVLVWSQEGAGGGRWRARSRFLRHDTSDMSRVWEGRLTGRT
ncbi:hypothetical protein ASR50_05385 [Streptomyces sp. 4F]|nr:hypothetical protein ASR50_05385 [Streptomyces sp. 4F]